MPHAAVSAERALTVQDIINALASPRPKYRTARPQKPDPEKQIVILRINFAMNSARLAPDAMAALNTLGEALVNARLRNYRFELAGHTDASGSEGYNQRLSEERALSVRRYLHREFGLDPLRLDPIGYGEARPHNWRDPYAAENRRVQISTTGFYHDANANGRRTSSLR